ncbi:MAG: alpha/beta fold hydrolase [Chloroflexota bacterium]
MGIARGSGLRIYYELTGTGRPLVLLHGAMGSIEAWRLGGYVEALAQGNQLILVDLRGHGLSEKPVAPDAYLAERHVEDVVAVLDDVGLESAVLLGWALGGDVALAAAASNPDRVDGVVAIGAFGSTVGFGDVKKPELKGVRALATRLAKEGMGSVVAPLEAAGRPEWARLVRRADAKAMAAATRSLTLVKRGDRRLADVRPPILAVWGEREAPVPPAPPFPDGTRTVTIPGEDAIGAFTRSDVVVPEIRAFLAKVPIRRLDV